MAVLMAPPSRMPNWRPGCLRVRLAYGRCHLGELLVDRCEVRANDPQRLVALVLDGLLHQDALRRVARVLHQHADILFGENAAVPRTYLPALVGTSREMTGRVLRNLESEGVVARRGRDRLELVDPVGLARAALGPSEA